jgi:SMC interacting uncharacterized protein involved in chromosome segregation
VYGKMPKSGPGLRDPRPLNDKAYQNSMKKMISQWLQEAGMSRNSET